MCQRGEELTAETGAKFVDQRGTEGVGVAERGNLTANTEIVWRTIANAALRECGASPRHSEIAVLRWAE